MRTLFSRYGRSLWTALRVMVVLTVILGVAYPLLITGIGQLILPWQANGSLLTNQSGVTVGSALLGQSFSDANGAPLPQYFQPRPSAAGDGYDGHASAGSNLGPENLVLITAIQERRLQIATFNDVLPSAVPPDAVTASGSGLDPDISPEYAAIQVHRVATTRGLTDQQVQALVDQYTAPPDLGYIGQAGVNVVKLNLALDELPR